MKYTVIFAILFAFFFESNAQKQFTYLVECVSAESEGFITLNIWSPKYADKYKLEQAQKDAIDAILFSGTEGGKTCARQKPILATEDAINKFNIIKKEFFSKNGDWTRFIRNAAIEYSNPENIENKKFTVYTITIAKDMLRNYLEEKKIIKSLKTGF